MNATTDMRDRACGTLLGLAIGDALGMPTQSFTPDEIIRHYGHVTGLVDAVPEQPIAPGMAAGTVTDDTEQALIVADLLVAGHGAIDTHAFAAALMAWEDDKIAQHSQDLLGPSTRAAIHALRDGADVDTIGTGGTTNGAAMRIAPVGVAVVPGDDLLAAVANACHLTHNTVVAIDAAAMVACVVSEGIAGTGVATALDRALAVADEAGTPGYHAPGALASARFGALRPWARVTPDDNFAVFLRQTAGTSLASQEAVTCALLLTERFHDRPFEALCMAANLGGDTDTIAAMVGAMLGACHGVKAFPEGIVSQVTARNDLHIDERVNGLLRLRRQSMKRQPNSSLPARPPMRRVIHTGQAVIDMVMRVAHIPEAGGDVFARSATRHAGGGFNMMAAAARDGGSVVYTGPHGYGSNGDLIRAALQTEGIPATAAITQATDTGTCFVLVDDQAERTFISTLGAEGTYQPEALTACHVQTRDIVYVSGYTLLDEQPRMVLLDWLETLPSDCAVVVDPCPLVDTFSEATLKRITRLATIWSCNEREAVMLATRLDLPVSSNPDLAQALASILDCAVIMRLGADGCIVATGDMPPTAIPAPVVKAIDTNGAGDAHCGVLCAALAHGMSLLDAARRANVAAALAVTRAGPATAPTSAEIDRLLLASPNFK